MSNSVLIGDFDSEKYWRNENLAKLPFIKDTMSTNIILAMDELLFPFCQKDDVLITRFSFDKTLKDYLSTVGFKFICNKNGYHTSDSDENKTIFQIISQDKNKLNDFLNYSKNCNLCSPYSIVPYVDILMSKAHFENYAPSIDKVKNVNSKKYSTELNKKLGFGTYSEIVYSTSDLLKKGEIFLEKGSFLIKDIYGVSGKGNLVIDSLKKLQRIASYIDSSISKGKLCTFILEELLDKELDFSCSLIIREDGKTEIQSIQKIINRQFDYGGSETMGKELIQFLHEKKYFDTISNIANNLYKDGYFGEVCVDSMLLKSGEIVPLIEINARKSMGFINNKIDFHLAKHGLSGTLMNINLGIQADLKLDDILSKLYQKEILFDLGKESGILPISSNTLFINKNLCKDKNLNQIHKGRVYFSLISKDALQKEKLLKNFAETLEELSCKIYSKI